MNRKLALGLALAAGVALLAVAASVAAWWMVPRSLSSGQLYWSGLAEAPLGKKSGGVSIALVPATEIPVASPDLVGQLVDHKDNRLFVRAQTKGGEAPLTEVVLAGATRLYRNATGDHLTEPPPPGAPIPMVVEA